MAANQITKFHLHGAASHWERGMLTLPLPTCMEIFYVVLSTMKRRGQRGQRGSAALYGVGVRDVSEGPKGSREAHVAPVGKST